MKQKVHLQNPPSPTLLLTNSHQKCSGLLLETYSRFIYINEMRYNEALKSDQRKKLEKKISIPMNKIDFNKDQCIR